MTVIPLRATISEGPLDNMEPDTGAHYWDGTPCVVCDSLIGKGERITYFGRGWSHEKCVTDALATAKADQAWLVLGSQLARRPSHFTAAETKAVVGQLLRIAGGFEPDNWAQGRGRHG